MSNLDALLRRPGLTAETIQEVLRGRRQRRVREQEDNSIPAVRARCAASLYQFIQDAWHVLEPSTPFVPGWHVKAICFPAGTKVLTADGERPIETVGRGEEVLSFDGGIVVRRVVRSMVSPACEVLTLHTHRGQIASTANHPFWVVGRGWVAASEVRLGDQILRAVRTGVSSRSEADALLFDGLFWRIQGEGGEVCLSRLRRPEGVGRQGLSELLCRTAETGIFDALRSMRRACLSFAGAMGADIADFWRVLQFEVFRPVLSGAQQSGLHRWWDGGVSSDTLRFRGRAREYSGARWEAMFSLPGSREAFGRSSRRPQPVQQFPVESGDALPALPQPAEGDAGSGYCLCPDIVSKIERGWSDGPVYNLEVADSHNYFAEGILVHNCDHLQAITEEACPQPPRLLINVPPGSQKSLTVTFWNAWEWGPRGLTGMRYLTTSFTEDAVKRDCRRVRALCNSDWFRTHWPEVELIREGELSIENSRTGSRDGVAFGSLVSRRGDRLVIDDPHSVEKAESDIDRRRAVSRFREGAVNRLNDQQKSAIVVIMQRLHEGDISGEIQTTGMGYQQLVLPMEYESSRHCSTDIGFSDPRTKDGELLCPARFSREAVDDLKRDMQIYAFAGQYQQRPAPRGGGILPYNAWEYWSKSEAMKYGRNESQFPDFEIIIGSLDTAFTEKQENDPSALVILGVWQNTFGQLQVMVMHCWAKRLKFSDLVHEVVKSCRKMRVTRLLIEGSASGISIQQEIQRLTRGEEFPIHQVAAKQNFQGRDDKEARAHAVSHFFAERTQEGALVRKGLVWVPAVEQMNGDAWPRAWAEELMSQAASFPKGKHDDLVDALVQGLRFLRQRGMVRQPREHEVDEVYKLMSSPVGPPPLYPA